VANHRGGFLLHASTVVGPTGALAFLGRSGQGKSTLAASFCERGFPLLGDDCLVLKEKSGALDAVPTYPGLRLWPDAIERLHGITRQHARVAHYTKKKRLTSEFCRFSRENAPLRGCYFLKEGEPTKKEPVRVRSLGAREAFLRLLCHSFRLDITDSARTELEFERLTRLARLPIHHELSYPRNLGGLSQVCDCVLRHANQSEF
jgi:hypothetical protein